MIAQELVEALTPKIQQVADGADIEYQTLRAWRSGVRTPSDENCEKLAALAEERANKLHRLAADLRSRANASDQ